MKHWKKYPRTFHFPWSRAISDDDKVLKSTKGFENQRIIVTMKMDGENNTFYSDHMHARSLDSRHHSSRDWAKQFWSGIRHDIPEGWRICVENMFAEHSIRYENLPSYVLGISVWNEQNVCLPWDDTLVWFEMLGITPVQVLYDGVFDDKMLRDLAVRLSADDEGYVVRVADAITYDDFGKKVGKFVRAGHVQTDQHWMHGEIKQNGLIG